MSFYLNQRLTLGSKAAGWYELSCIHMHHMSYINMQVRLNEYVYVYLHFWVFLTYAQDAPLILLFCTFLRDTTETKQPLYHVLRGPDKLA